METGKKLKFFAVVASAVLLASGCAESEAMRRATTPVPRSADPENWWCRRYREKAEIARSRGDRIRLVFLGDSITQNFEREKFGKIVADEALAPYEWLNLGFIGDRTQQMLYVIEHGDFFPPLEPDLVVILIGTNHFEFHESGPEEAAEGILRAVRSLRRLTPKSKILLVGVLPHAQGLDSGHNAGNRRINGIISAYADAENVFYADFSPLFLNADGTTKKDLYLDDLLHPSEKGYRVYAAALRPYLEKYVSKTFPEREK
ncbi:MAG: GDSL-type esterase/lipase family protein [Victivallaceae bacterium]|nr:GDSL-type esterase/lipase family protein [Victivallaceae bacterium]